MADTILKNTNGNIWVDSTGKIMKSKSFSETVLQSGLAFWGIADPNYLTIIDGLVSEAYDIRGTGKKMIQDTVSSRPAYTGNELFFNGQKELAKVNETLKSAFIVLNVTAVVATGSNGIAFNTSNPNAGALGSVANVHANFINPTYKPFYLNSILIPTTTIFSLNYYRIISSSTDLNAINQTIRVGCFNTALYSIKVKEWGWYNRALTTPEVVYNINALNAKYQIF